MQLELGPDEAEDVEGEGDDDEVGAIDINPFSWLAAAAQGALKGGIDKAREDTSDEAQEGINALKAWKVQQKVAKAQAQAQAVVEKQERKVRRVAMAKRKATDAFDFLRSHAMVIGLGFGGLALAISFAKK